MCNAASPLSLDDIDSDSCCCARQKGWLLLQLPRHGGEGKLLVTKKLCNYTRRDLPVRSGKYKHVLFHTVSPDIFTMH